MTSPPAQIGPYTIDREIGSGGMGVVYLGRDTRLDRAVAIKALPEHLAQDPERLARFEREAKTLATLSHPNVAGIYGVEEQDGKSYLVLEYVEGETLAERLARGPLPVEDALDVCAQIAAGVEAAHEAGVIHRDLKPANVKITPDGDVKVLDFGLARAGEAGSTTGSGEALSASPTLTAPHSPTNPGAILGTAPYMSPEQARGKRVDRRTDVWSLGCVLYECLTGATLFGGETSTDSIGAILHRSIDLDALPANTPQGVRRLLRRCLERDRSQRLRDIGDARLELMEAMRSGAEPAPVAASVRRRTSARLGYAVALLAIAALVYVAAREGPEPQPRVVRSSLMAPPGVVVEDIAISPDGRKLAFTATLDRPDPTSEPGASVVDSLYVRGLASAEPVLIEHSAGVMHAAFSPDGRTLAFTSSGPEGGGLIRLYRLPADLSTPPVEVMTPPDRYARGSLPGRFAWSPDGLIAMLDSAALEVALFDPGAGREVRTVKVRTDLESPDIVSLVDPFGDRYVTAHLTTYTDRVYREDAAAIDLETGELHVLVENANFPWLTSGGDMLFSRSDTIYLSAFDQAQMRMVGEFRPAQSGVATRVPWGHGEYELARDGSLAYLSGGVQGAARRLVFIDADGEHSPAVDDRRPFDEAVVLSPDGRRLAVMIAGAGSLYEIWVSEVDRPRLRPLLAAPRTDFFKPVFTPDGETIVVARWNPEAEEPGRLLAVPFDGGEPPRRIYGGWTRANGRWVVPQSLWPDGRRVLAVEYAAGDTTLLEAPLDGGEVRPLLAMRNMWTPTLSPTEPALLAYITDDLGRPEAYVRAVADSGVGPAIPVTSRGAWSTRWSLDDEEGLLLHTVNLDQREFVTPIRLLDGRIDVGETTPTGRVFTDRMEAVDIARDGRLLAIMRGEDEAPIRRIELVQNWLSEVEAAATAR